MERELKHEFVDIDIVIDEGEHGVFEVFLGGTVIFAKREESCCQNRLPRPGEINDIVRRLSD